MKGSKDPVQQVQQVLVGVTEQPGGEETGWWGPAQRGGGGEEIVGERDGEIGEREGESRRREREGDIRRSIGVRVQVGTRGQEGDNSSPQSSPQ